MVVKVPFHPSFISGHDERLSETEGSISIIASVDC